MAEFSPKLSFILTMKLFLHFQHFVFNLAQWFSIKYVLEIELTTSEGPPHFLESNSSPDRKSVKGSLYC